MANYTIHNVLYVLLVVKNLVDNIWQLMVDRIVREIILNTKDFCVVFVVNLLKTVNTYIYYFLVNNNLFKYDNYF